MKGKNGKLKIKLEFGKIAVIMIAVFVVLLIADLVLKFCAEEYAWQFKVIPKLIEVVPIQYNTGAAFSFLAGKEWAYIFFIVLTTIMLIAMIFAFIILPERFVILKLALAMICAGAMGNLVDRCAFHSVRDFVDVNMFGKVACCNFADFWIVFGVILAVIDVMFLNEWAVFPLTKRAKEWAKKLKEDDEPAFPPQEIPPMPEEFNRQEEGVNPTDEEVPAEEDESLGQAQTEAQPSKQDCGNEDDNAN